MGKAKPFYDDGQVTIFCGDVRRLARLARGDAVVTVLPRLESRCVRDQWLTGWPKAVRRVAPALWCVGSFRMFHRYASEFAGWQVGHDVIWEHQPDDSPAPDGRIIRAHETIVHWYHGAWKDVYRQPVYVHEATRDRRRRLLERERQGQFGADVIEQMDGAASRPLRSVIYARHAAAGCACGGGSQDQREGGGAAPMLPDSVLRLLIEHAVPPGGTLVDPFCGEGRILAVAKSMGRRAVGFDLQRRACQIAAWRIAQDDLPMESCLDDLDDGSPSLAPQPAAGHRAETLVVPQELFAN